MRANPPQQPVRAVPELTKNMAPQTIDSDAPAFAQPGKTRDLSRANPVCIEIPVTVQGSRQNTGGAAPAVPQPFVEETRTVLVFQQGAVLRMSATTAAGQILIVKNIRMDREAACRVVNSKAPETVKGYVEVEFLEPAPGFWGIDFPGPSAGRTAPALDRTTSDPPPVTALAATLPAQPSAPRAPKSAVPLLPDLLPAESQSRTVSPREASPTSLFGWEPPAQTPAAKPAEVATSAEKSSRPAGQQGQTAAEATSLTDLLDSLTPLGEQVLLGKNSAAGTTGTSLRKTPVPIPGAFTPIPVAPAVEKPAERKSHDFSLRVSPEMAGLESHASATPGTAPDFERPSPSLSLEGSFSLPPRTPHSSAVLGGPIFSAGESEQTDSSASGSKTWLVVGAIALIVAAGSAFGYYRFYAHPQTAASPAVAFTPPAPRPSPHDVTAPVDTPPDAAAAQPAPAQSDLPSADQTPSAAQPPVEKPAPARAPAAQSETPAAPKDSTDSTGGEQATAPEPTNAAPAQQTPNPTNLKLSTPTVTTTSSSPVVDAPSITGDMPGAIPGGTSGLGVIAPPSSQSIAPPAPKTDFRPPQLISSLPLLYPDVARRQGVQGDVVVDLLVDKSGKVAEAKVVSGPPLLWQGALDSLRKNKYKPATLDGKPTSAHITVTVHFKR